VLFRELSTFFVKPIRISISVFKRSHFSYIEFDWLTADDDFKRVWRQFMKVKPPNRHEHSSFTLMMLMSPVMLNRYEKD